MESDHALARTVFRDLVADCNDGSSDFVPVYAWCGKQVVRDFLEVGMTNTTAFDTQQYFTHPDLWRFDVLDRDPAVSEIDGGFHKARNTLTRSDLRPARN